MARTAFEVALSLLAARAYSVRALAAKLATHFETAEIEGALVRLVDLGLLDDKGFAERFVEDHFVRAGHGRHRLRRELERRGIESGLAVEVIERLVPPEAERDRAAALLDRMTAAMSRRRRTLESDDLRAFLFRRLVARGFPSSVVRELLGVPV